MIMVIIVKKNKYLKKSHKKLKCITLFDEFIINYFGRGLNETSEIYQSTVSLYFSREFYSYIGSITLSSQSLLSIKLIRDHGPIESGFEWRNISNKLSVITGLNGIGKTSLLISINESIKKCEDLLDFCNVIYFNTAENKLDLDQNNFDELNKIIKSEFLKSREKTDKIIYVKKSFYEIVYENINYFSLLQYFDYLVLIYVDLNSKLSKKLFKFSFNEQRLEEIRSYQSKFQNDCVAMEYYENRKIEYYLLDDKDRPLCYTHLLSPGERLILLLELWRIHANHLKESNTKAPVKIKLKIVLLDEPDSHMHPSLIKEFINLITNGNLDFLRFQVIMTTHNPITVSLTPIENTFELKRDDLSNRLNLNKLKNKKTAILSLTEHLISVDLPTRLVFVEATDDKLFYEKLQDYLLQIKFNYNITGEFRLLFIAGVTANKKDSCKTFVKGIVEKCVDHGKIEHMFGIVDKDSDKDNKPKTNIQVIKRYCLENYLFDPINIYLYLLHSKKSNEIQTSIKINTFDDFFQLEKDNLKMLFEDILKYFKNELDPNDSYKETTKVEFCYNFSENSKDTFSVEYPNFFIQHHGHGKGNGLRELVTEKYSIKDNKEMLDFLFKEIMQNYNYLRLIPFDLIQIFINIQNPDYSNNNDNDKTTSNEIKKIKDTLLDILKNKDIDALKDVSKFLEIMMEKFKNIDSIEQILEPLLEIKNKYLVEYYGKYYSLANNELNNIINNFLRDIKENISQ